MTLGHITSWDPHIPRRGGVRANSPSHDSRLGSMTYFNQWDVSRQDVTDLSLKKLPLSSPWERHAQASPLSPRTKGRNIWSKPTLSQAWPGSPHPSKATNPWEWIIPVLSHWVLSLLVIPQLYMVKWPISWVPPLSWLPYYLLCAQQWPPPTVSLGRH